MTSTFPETGNAFAESMFRAGMLAAEPGLGYLLVHKAGRIIVEIFENTIHDGTVILSGGSGSQDPEHARVWLQRDGDNREAGLIGYASLEFGHAGTYHVIASHHSIEDMQNPDYSHRAQLNFETDDLDKALNGLLIPWNSLRTTQ